MVEAAVLVEVEEDMAVAMTAKEALVVHSSLVATFWFYVVTIELIWHVFFNPLGPHSNCDTPDRNLTIY
jgi:hypothetical protein